MERLTELSPRFVEFMPDALEHGVLYVSKKYGVAIHLCACGCGEKTVTPFGSPSGWTLEDVDGAVTLNPSVYNYQVPCRAHYFVRRNKVEWCG